MGSDDVGCGDMGALSFGRSLDCLMKVHKNISWKKGNEGEKSCIPLVLVQRRQACIHITRSTPLTVYKASNHTLTTRVHIVSTLCNENLF